MQLKKADESEVSYSSELLGNEIRGKTIGIIGLGHIGNKIAEIGASLRMNINYWSRNKRDVPYNYMNLENVIKESDFIFLSLSKNEKTKGLLTKELLSNMNPDACFITIVSEGIEDRAFLIEQANNDKIGGLAFESETDRVNSYRGNIMITKPYAWYTKDALDNLFVIWTDTIVAVCQNEPINVVNK